MLNLITYLMLLTLLVPLALVLGLFTKKIDLDGIIFILMVRCSDGS